MPDSREAENFKKKWGGMNPLIVQFFRSDPFAGYGCICCQTIRYRGGDAIEIERS